MIKNIAVVTGTRAEYGILKPLLRRISKSGHLRLSLLVTGLHLLKKYGFTLKEIKKDGFKVTGIVKMYTDKEKDITYYGKSVARGIAGFTSILSDINPDIVIVFGDRLEQLSATIAAATLSIPIAHIHGGDRTDSGHIDESIRHSITRFAHIHFPATKEHEKRLLKMGEEQDRIFRVGALGLDSILERKYSTKEDLSKKLGVDLNGKTAVCLFHSVNLEKEDIRNQMHEIVSAIKEMGTETIIIYPNNDFGNKDIIEEIEKVKDNKRIKIFPSLQHDDYIDILKHADVLIGNSSSGIIEAPVLKLPVVNIGSRNFGRQHAENVVFVKAKKEKIVEAIKKALYDDRFKKRVENAVNPYGDGKTGRMIVDVLCKTNINMKLMTKRITY